MCLLKDKKVIYRKAGCQWFEREKRCVKWCKEGHILEKTYQLGYKIEDI